MSKARYSIFAARAVFDTRLPDGAVRVLAALGTYANDEGWCYPNQSTIAERTGIRRETVCRSIKLLVECGYVETETRTASQRGKTGLNYRVKLDLPREDVEKKAFENPDVRSGSQREESPMCAEDHNGPDVSVGSQPMCAEDHNGYIAVTTPRERPQTLQPSAEEEARRKFEEAEKAKAAVKAKTKRKPAAKSKAKPRAALIAHEWVPSDRTREYASELGFEIWEVEAAAEEFREYWEGRNDRLAYKLDWEGTFKRRLRDIAADDRQRRKLKFVKPAVNGHALITKDQWEQGLEMWRSNRRWIKELGPRPDQTGYRGPPLERAI